MTRTITLAANASHVETVAAKVFACISSTGVFTIRPGNENTQEMASGRGIGSPASNGWTRLEITNTSGASNTINYYLGDENFDNAAFRTSGRTQRTFQGPWATFQTTDTYTITGTQPIGAALGDEFPSTQKRVVIYNTHASQILGLFDFTTGLQIARIAAKSHLDFALPAVGDFAISLDPASAGPITADVMTEYYDDDGALGIYWGLR